MAVIGQSGPPNTLVHDWCEPPVDLAAIDVGNAVANSPLPYQSYPFLGRVHGAFLATRLGTMRSVLIRSEAFRRRRPVLPVPALRPIELIALDRQCGKAFAHLVPGTLIAGVYVWP
jgi:hypothetical protein